MMKGYRTTIFAALLVMFGALQAAMPDLKKAISPTLYPYILMGVGIIVHILRTATDTPIFTDNQWEPTKNVQHLVAAVGMAFVALVGALFPTPAPAVTQNANGTVTFTLEEIANVDRAIGMMHDTIEKMGTLIEQQQKKLKALEKAKCT
jgi:uncharacterized membrane protein